MPATMMEPQTFAPTETAPASPAPVLAEAAPETPDPATLALEQFRMMVRRALMGLCHPAVTDGYDFDAEVFNPLRDRVRGQLRKTAIWERYRRLRGEVEQAEAEAKRLDTEIAGRRAALGDQPTESAAALIALESELAPLEGQRAAVGNALATLTRLLREAKGAAQAELNRLVTEEEISLTQDLTAQQAKTLEDVIDAIDGDLIRASRLGMGIQRLAMPYTGLVGRMSVLLDEKDAGHE